MNFFRHVASSVGVALLLPGAPSLASSTSPTTDAAMASGQAEYLSHCASCHGAKFSGEFGRPLNDDAFRAKWLRNGSAALQKFISESMPPSDPGSLSMDTYQRITRFIQSANDMPPDAKGSVDSVAAPVDAASHSISVPGAVDLMAFEKNTDALYSQSMQRRASTLRSMRSVDETMLRSPPNDDWLQWRRTDDGGGFSPLSQVDNKNVHRLSLAWAKSLPAGTNGITPLVHDGVMFINSAGTVLALDVRTGEQLWKFVRNAQVPPLGPPVSQPRGMALFQDLLLVPTLDDHMIALDIRSGTVVWDHLVTAMHNTLRLTGGPIVVHGKVIQGVAGCAGVAEPRGCFIAGFDARSGAELWRVYTIPAPDEPGGNSWNGAPADKRFGASVWSAGTYDPESNLVYFGTGQTYHIGTLMLPNGKVTDKNSGLYTDSTLAINPDTGQLVWHFQHMARDVWDLDWAFERLVLTVDFKGSKRRAVATMGKLGILDVLDAKTGQYLFSHDIGMQNLVTAIDPLTGRKVTDPKMEPDTAHEMSACPFAIGVRNWPATSYDPDRKLLYVPLGDSCMTMLWKKGEDWDISFHARPNSDADGNNGRFDAIDIGGRSARWTKRYRAPVISAALATAGGIVFQGGFDRVFRALDSDSGDILWDAHLDNTPAGTPISFAAGGTQYIEITTGGGNPNDSSRMDQAPEFEPAARGTTLWLFKLAAPN